MIQKETAQSIALAEINRCCAKTLDLVILEEYTQEEDFGWVFYYNTKQYIEGDESAALGGNAPIIINRNDGSVHVTGTTHPTEEYIAQYRDLLNGKIKQRIF